MSTREGYRYAVQIERADGAVVAERPARVDWGPAVEWARWQSVRRGAEVGASLVAEVAVEPVWTARGAPLLEGVAVTSMAARDALPTRYFADAAQLIATELVAEGQLADQEVFRYRPIAYAVAAGEEAPRRCSTAAPPAIEVHPGELADSLLGAERLGESDPADAPVLVPAQVLAECSALTLERSGVETGGILIGYLRRDQLTGACYLEVTAQIAARHTEGTATKLTFTPDTWSDVRAAIALRAAGEIHLGHWHSHPVKAMCQCPEEKWRQGCPLGEGFFSTDDRLLHRTVFSRGFNVALVVSDVHEGPPKFALFGWRHGLIERRGFYRIEERSHVAA